ncbi:MAG: cellulose binding domain-containing protein [Pseudomonadota bacterium]
MFYEDLSFEGVSIEYRILGQWDGGETASIIVTNGSERALNDLGVQWRWSGDTVIDYVWNAEVEQQGDLVQAQLPEQLALNPGEALSFGFNLSYSDQALPEDLFVF